MTEWSPYPHLARRPSAIARDSLNRAATFVEYNQVADMIAAFERLENIADDAAGIDDAHRKEVEALTEQIDEGKSDLALASEEHAEQIDDLRDANIALGHRMRVIDRAFMEIGIDLPLDPDTWTHTHIMEAFASRMAVLMETGRGNENES